MTDDASSVNRFFHKTRLYVFIAIAIAALIVIWQNSQSIETKILFFTITMPLAALLAATTLAGFTAGIIWSGFRRRK